MAPTPEVTGYSDLAEIGRGGFARVYRAHQDRFNRAVALKVLNLADPDERTRDRFERECQAMGELSWHPHVVAVYDSGITDDGHLWLAMEHLQRGSLADAMTSTGVFGWPAAVTAGIEVCGALGAAHAAGTLHRDLKPENVLVGPFGEAKLADFGIAAVDGGRRTTTGVASFTVAHVAPEVLRGQRQDERTDVYGLASTLHTLLAGASPFAGDRDEPVATVMMRIIEAAPPRLGGPVPADLADLLLGGLAKDPDDRPQTAAAFGEALQAIQQASGLAPTPLRLAPTPPAPPTVTTPVPLAPVDADPPPSAPATADSIPTDPTSADPTSADPTPADPTPADPTPAVDEEATVTVVAPPAPVTAPSSVPPPPPPPPAPVADRSTAAPPTSGTRGRFVIIAAAVVLVLLVGAVVLITTGGGDDGDDPGVTQTAAFATSPVAVAVNDDAVWVTDAGDTLLYKLDPETGDEITNTGLNNIGAGIALTDNDAGWIIGDDTADMIRIDLPTNSDTDQLEVGENQTSISADGTDVWIARGADGDTGKLVRVNAVDLGLVTEIEVGTGPNQVAATDDIVWVASAGDRTLTRVDPDINEIKNVISLDVVPSAVAASEDAVWVLSTESASLTRIDPATNEVVAVINLDQAGGAEPNAVATSPTTGAVWVTDGELDKVTLIAEFDNSVFDTIPVGQEPVAVAATDNDVWVANSGDGTLTHIDRTVLD